MIELKNIEMKYSTEYIDTLALYNVSLNINQGEFVSICGPSGSGKSTLLSIMGILEKPTSGRYLINSTDIFSLTTSQMSIFRRDNIGFIFQAFNLIESLSVLDNVALPLICRNESRSKAHYSAKQVLEQLGMAQRIDHYPYQLSGGQQQRVAIARALVAKPKLVLADEPTGNLDSENGLQVLESLKSLHALGSTICLVTHDENISKLTQRVIRMQDGSICEV